MNLTETIELISLIITALGLIISLGTAIAKGKLKQFVIEKMEEAEASGKSGEEKLLFVMNAVKEKYKIVAIVMNVKRFIEKVIAVTKKINAKGE